jgi:predicted exporter
MVGFLLFLVPYRSVLSVIRFRTLAWRPITIRPWLVAGISGASVLAMAVVGFPRFATQIDRFRPRTPVLDEQVRHFTRRLTALSLEDVVAIPAASTPQAALEPFLANGLVDGARHPLASWRPLAEQERTLSTLAGGHADAVRRLASRLADVGIRISPAPELPPQVQRLGAWEYLELLGTIGPARWTDTVAGRRYVMAGLRGSPAGKPLGDAIALSPRFHYDELLSSFSRELGWLFVGGIGLMVVYVAALQRSVARVLYVFAPLFIAGLAFAVYARWSGGTVNIVHVMGFSLVIALGTDYTAVLVATDHAPPETTKVLLTGISALATFGVLLLARHPVLRELGATVAIGCAASLTFALLFRLPATHRDGSL